MTSEESSTIGTALGTVIQSEAAVIPKTFSERPSRYGGKHLRAFSMSRDAAMGERVTVAMAPFENFSAFPAAVKSLYENTSAPFELIVIEGNAPDSVREALERQKKKRRHMRIIYTNHRPNLAESWNLAFPHVRTKYVFFTSNDVRFRRGWLTQLIAALRLRNSEILSPHILNDNSGEAISVEAREPSGTPASNGMELGTQGVRLHGFLITKNALEKMGSFDENVSAMLTGLDITAKALSQHIPIGTESKAVLTRELCPPLSPSDRELFDLQWSHEKIGKSLKYIRRKWGITLEEDKYLSWLEQNRLRTGGVRLPFIGNFTYHFQSQVAFAKSHVKRFFEPVIKPRTGTAA